MTPPMTNDTDARAGLVARARARAASGMGFSAPETGALVTELADEIDRLAAALRAVTAPGHTDLMVSPESINAFMEANQLPDEVIDGDVTIPGTLFRDMHAAYVALQAPKAVIESTWSGSRDDHFYQMWQAPRGDGEPTIADFESIGLHPDTSRLVRQFMSAVASKLRGAELKYGYSNGWLKDDWQDECQARLLEHLAKGDPRDVAAYCAFLWHHNWPTTSPSPTLSREAVARIILGPKSQWNNRHYHSGDPLAKWVYYPEVERALAKADAILAFVLRTAPNRPEEAR